MAESLKMAESLAETAELAPTVADKSPRLFRFATRTAVWGTLAGVGAFVASTVFGAPLVTWLVSGAGLVLGGVGTLGLSSLLFRRKDLRPIWKLNRALGVPFGLSLTVTGLWFLLGLPSTIFGGIWTAPPAVIPIAITTVIIIGLALFVITGADLLRFLFMQSVDD